MLQLFVLNLSPKLLWEKENPLETRKKGSTVQKGRAGKNGPLQGK